MRNRIVTVMVILVFSMIFMGQEASAAWPWSTATPTPTRFMTSTPVPSFTPTRTPRPTSTPTRVRPTATRVMLNTPVVPVLTPIARATEWAKQQETSTQVATSTPFLSVTVQPSVEKQFVVTPIPAGVGTVYVSCNFCTSIYYSYPIRFDMRRGYTFSGSTLSVPVGASLYVEPNVGFGKSCAPSSARITVQEGYNSVEKFACTDD